MSITADVLDDTGTPIVGSPFALTHQTGGLYTVSIASQAAGDYSARIDPNNAAYTIDYESIRVHSVWDELQVDHVVTGSFGEDADAAVSSRAAPGDAMDLVADAVDAAAVATSGANEIRDSILSDATAFAGADVGAILADTAAIEPLATANLDATVSSRATQADILSDATPFAGADVAAILADTAAIDGRLPVDPADESSQLAAHAQTQADIAALNNLSQADILSDATPFPGANVDAAISTRAAPGDAMDLVTDAVDADAVATTGAQEIRDEILSDATPFAGANVDAAVSSRSSHNPADVDTQLSSVHGAGSWEGDSAQDWTAGERENIRQALGVDGAKAAGGTPGDLQDVLADTAAIQPLVDVAVSSRSDHNPADVDAQLSAVHGAGSWEDGGGGGGGDWTEPEKEQIRGALGVQGAATEPSGFGHLQEVLAHEGGLGGVVDEVSARDGDNLITSATRRIYDNAADAIADNTGNAVRSVAVSAANAGGLWNKLTRSQAAGPGAFEITAFVRGFSSPLEVGENVVTPSFTAAYSNAPTTALLDDSLANPTDDVSGTPAAFSSTHTYVQVVPGGTVVWTLTADDGGAPDTRQVSAIWYPGVFTGLTASPGPYSEAEIEALTKRLLPSSQLGQIILTPINQYIVHAYPDSFGPRVPTDFQIGTVGPGDMTQIQTGLSITNPFGTTLPYSVARSDFLLNSPGGIEFEVFS